MLGQEQINSRIGGWIRDKGKEETGTLAQSQEGHVIEAPLRQAVGADGLPVFVHVLLLMW